MSRTTQREGSPLAVAAAAPGPSTWLVRLLAVVVGAAVANIYYAQPLLPRIGPSLGVSEATGALLVTAAQVGYALALALIVPLGDLTERRRLVTLLVTAAAVTLALAAAAPDFAVLALAVVLVGAASAVAQVVVPLAASLADDEHRGSVVGTVMSGLLIGILVARAFSGALAALGGWRTVYAVAAALMLVMACAVRTTLPRLPAPATPMPYRRALRSVTDLVRTQPVLRQRMGMVAFGMGCFTVLWASVAFLLAGPGYRYSPAVIGLFSLAGLAGAAASRLGGRLVDRGPAGGRRHVVPAALAALLLSWGLLALGAVSLVPLVAGMIILDFALQTLNIHHQTAVYALVSGAHSRLTTALTVSRFAGGAVASACVATLYPAAGWSGVCGFGAVLALGSMLWWFTTEVRMRTVTAGR